MRGNYDPIIGNVECPVSRWAIIGHANLYLLKKIEDDRCHNFKISWFLQFI